MPLGYTLDTWSNMIIKRPHFRGAAEARQRGRYLLTGFGWTPDDKKRGEDRTAEGICRASPPRVGKFNLIRCGQLLNELLRGALVVIVGSLRLLIAVVAVDGDDGLAFFGVADVDESVLKSGDQVSVHDLGVLADGDGVVVDRGGHADDVRLFPDGAFTAKLGVPALGIVASRVGVGHKDIDLTGGQTPTFARVIRAQVLTIKDQEFVEAARSAGASDARIIFRYIVPNALSPMIVQVTMGMASAILSIAGLSFIGMGIQAPMSEWGAMLSNARTYIRDAWHITVMPGAAIMITILILNIIGDGLRDALDPRMKN